MTLPVNLLPGKITLDPIKLNCPKPPAGSPINYAKQVDDFIKQGVAKGDEILGEMIGKQVKNGKIIKEEGIIKKTINIVKDKYNGLPTWGKVAAIAGGTLLGLLGLSALSKPQEAVKTTTQQ